MLKNFRDGLVRQMAMLRLANDQRLYLMHVIKEYTTSGQPVFQVFDQLHRRDPHAAIRDLSMLSKRAIRDNVPFAIHWAQKGYFSASEANLLMAGERHDCLGPVCDLFIEKHTTPKFFIKAIGSNFEWFIVIAACIFIAIVGLDKERYYRGDERLFFFTMGEFLQDWGVSLAIGFGLLAVGYVWAISHLTGPLRKQLEKLGCFHLHNHQLELRILDICAALYHGNTPPKSILDALAESFKDQATFLIKLQRARASLAERNFVESLPMIISAESMQHIHSKAPQETNAQLAAGFELAARMKRIHLERYTQTAHTLFQLVCMLITLGISIPVIEALMGAGLQ